MANSGISIIRTATDLIFVQEVKYRGFTVSQPPVEIIPISERSHWRGIILSRLSSPVPDAPGPIEFNPKERHPAYVALGCRTLREYNFRTTHYSLGYNDTSGFVQGPATAKGSQQGFNWTTDNTLQLPVAGQSAEAIAALLLSHFERVLDTGTT